MFIQERLQALIHLLEVGFGTRVIRWLLVLVVMTAVVVVYDLRAYHGFNASEAMDAAQVARAACVAAAEKYAPQTETYSDALKLVMYQTKDNPTDQTAQVQRLQSDHEKFTAQAKASEQAKPQPASEQEISLDLEVKHWVIDELFVFAKDKYGQDKLFFKFYINNRCKERFAHPR